MITYLGTDIFTSPAQTLVNTVNTIGVMGKGIAKTFKTKFPQMFEEYKKICDQNQLEIGKLHLWRGPHKWVLNFPTKTTWKKPSELDYIRRGLGKFRDTHEQLGITSISFPPLGCGNGQLDWAVVKPLFKEYLNKLPIQIFVHEVPVGRNFVPEHVEALTSTIPASFENFMRDISAMVLKEKGLFSTIKTTSEFEASVDSENIKIKRKGGSVNIPADAILTAWSILQTGVLSSDQFNDESGSRYKSYLFPILAQLPYIAVTQTSNSWDMQEKYALILKDQGAKKNSDPQGSLWQSH